MNDGKISVRYARALLGYAESCGEGDAVYREMLMLSRQLETYASEFQQVLHNPILTRAEKLRVLILASGGEVSTCQERFLSMVLDHHRESNLYLIAMKYLEMYKTKRNILVGKLHSAIELPDDTMQKIRAFVEGVFHAKVEMHAVVDPQLIGGFIVDIDNMRYDASVSGLLNNLRKKL